MMVRVIAVIGTANASIGPTVMPKSAAQTEAQGCTDSDSEGEGAPRRRGMLHQATAEPLRAADNLLHRAIAGAVGRS